MANPFFEACARGNNSKTANNALPNLNQIYKMFSNSNNPMQVFENIAKSNPNMAPIMNLLKNGYSPEQIFNFMCQKRGVDPQQFINSITK